VPGIGLGIAKCPYDPVDNSTAVFVQHGNPGGFPALVSVPTKYLMNFQKYLGQSKFFNFIGFVAKIVSKTFMTLKLKCRIFTSIIISFPINKTP
jgi:hypothetical protein